MIMASRLLYGMSNEGVVPAALGAVHGGRRTPYVAIVGTTVAGGGADRDRRPVRPRRHDGLPAAAVFITVNVSVLVLRREHVDHDHFTAPSVIPVLGALVCLWLMIFKTDGEAAQRSLFVLAVGAVLFVVSRRQP